ncbi:MAG: DUF58 domain-containing protein [Planctomycetaceae bacterium]|nr:DUF58 domain-containing protein [Planctomycetaceae bacterium]
MSTSIDWLQDPEVQQAISRYQMGLPRLPTAGRSGDLLGRGTGSSLEFQEYREYLPGDDLRHVDWGAYARTDALMVRLFREEISPRTEIVLDASVSMTTQQGVKQKLALQLTSLFSQLTNRLGGQPVIHFLNSHQPTPKLSLSNLSQGERLNFDGLESMGELLSRNALTFKPQSVRIVISDFLFPLDPELLIKRLSHNASALWLIQILGEWERNPRPDSGRRLTDIETGEHADMMLSSQVIATYRERLQRLTQGMTIASRRARATFVTLVGEEGLDEVCREDLSRVEILRPA